MSPPARTQLPVEDKDERYALRTAFAVAHGYAAALVESDKFRFVKLRPERVFFAGGFGVGATWVDNAAFVGAVADPLALESLQLVNRLNADAKADLQNLCAQVKHTGRAGGHHSRAFCTHFYALAFKVDLSFDVGIVACHSAQVYLGFTPRVFPWVFRGCSVSFCPGCRVLLRVVLRAPVVRTQPGAWT